LVALVVVVFAVFSVGFPAAVYKGAPDAPVHVAVREIATDGWHDVIELEGIIKVYRMGNVDVAALQGVDLSIREGEMVAIMGPSGSGKSTLMNIIGCLDVPTSGHYYLEGEEVGGLGDNRLAAIRNRKIGFVFQTYNLLPRLTALANVELPLMYGNGRNRRKRAVDALERVGLGPRIGHRPTELSGGEQQRVGIARALVKEPTLLLTDEPTGNLDSRSSVEIMAILQDLNREEGISVVVVTHDRDIADHTQRIVSMLDGVVVGDQKVHEPRQAVVASEGRGGSAS
jgi:putative ABC transport system ATP-binding protein